MVDIRIYPECQVGKLILCDEQKRHIENIFTEHEVGKIPTHGMIREYVSVDPSIIKKVTTLFRKIRRITSIVTIDVEMVVYNATDQLINLSKHVDDQTYLMSDMKKDDYQTKEPRFYTGIYYAKIDKTIKGGSVQFYDKRSKFAREVVPKENDFLLFRSDQLHGVKSIGGSGYRKLIIFYFSTTNDKY
jgi:hypothetical protein